MFIKTRQIMFTNEIRYNVVNNDFSTIIDKSWSDNEHDENGLIRFDNDNELIAYCDFATLHEYIAHEYANDETFYDHVKTFTFDPNL